GGLVDSLLSELADVNEAIFGAVEIHEGAEVNCLHDRTVINHADLGIGSKRFDPFDRGINRLGLGRSNFYGAVILDIDLGAGFLDDFADHLSAGADHVADLVDRYLDHLDARRMLAELRTRGGQSLGHFTEDVQATFLGLGERDLHDLFGDAGDLDIHLQRGDTLVGARHLEVHVAEMILVAENVGEHG